MRSGSRNSATRPGGFWKARSARSPDDGAGRAGAASLGAGGAARTGAAPGGGNSCRDSGYSRNRRAVLRRDGALRISRATGLDRRAGLNPVSVAGDAGGGHRLAAARAYASDGGRDRSVAAWAGTGRGAGG